MEETIRCMRCGRKSGASFANWNSLTRGGFFAGNICPECQTPEENAEAEMNDAIIDYSRAWMDADGRCWAPLKGDPTSGRDAGVALTDFEGRPDEDGD